MGRKRLPTMKLAEQVLARARARVAAMEGTYVFRGDAKTTVAEYAPQWLASVRVESSTLCTYEGYLRCHVVAHLGHRSMASLKRSDVNAFIGTVIKQGARAAHRAPGLRAARDDAALRRLRPAARHHCEDRPGVSGWRPVVAGS